MGKTKASWAPQCGGGGEAGLEGGRRVGSQPGPPRGGLLVCCFPGQESLGPHREPHHPQPPSSQAPGRAGLTRGPLAVTSFLVSKPTGPSPGLLQGGLGNLRLFTPEPRGSPESHVLSAWTQYGHTRQHLTGSFSFDPLNRGKGALLCSPHFTGKETAAQRAD